MNPELLGSFLSARPTGRQFGPARIAAVPICFHWGVVASDPASAFEDVLSLDTVLARKNKSCRFRKSYCNTKSTNCWLLTNWKVWMFLHFQGVEFFFWVSWQVWLGHLQARYEGWILAHPTRSQSLGKKNILPKTGLWNPWRCCFWAQQGRLVASVQSPPETFAKKPIWLQCNRHTSRGLWKQPGPRMRVHNHLPIFWTNTDIISPKHCLRDLFRIYPIFRHVYSNML